MHFRTKHKMMDFTTTTATTAMLTKMFGLLLVLISGPLMSGADAALDSDLQVIYAVNAGGNDHTDKHGILYETDHLTVGTASDYGNHLLIIGRISEQDEVLYRTERYHTATFGYDLPLEGDGSYALVLKFCEVYFNEPNMKIFDVVLNRQHEIVSNLDIFAKVGRGTAHDEYIYFTVSRGKLHYKDEVSDIRNNAIRLEFIKGGYDNPKVNAFALFKGDIERIPRLAPLQINAEKDFDEGFEEKSQEINGQSQTKKTKKTAAAVEDKKTSFDLNEEPIDSEEDLPIDDNFDNEGVNDMDYLLKDNRKNSKTSGPRQPNPYTSDDSMVLMPVIVAIGCFIPLLFCLCKL